MDVMMSLKGAGFSAIANAFREREKRLGGGLPLLDFVEIVLRGLPRPKSSEEKAASVSALVDLFEDIDINGDGAMDFEEFTSFCVDAGMVAARSQVGSLKHRYEVDPKHALKTSAFPHSDSNSRGPTSSSSTINPPSTGIERIKWSPGFRMFFVLENAARSVKLFSSDSKFITEVCVAPEQQSQKQVNRAPATAATASGLDVPLNDVVVVGDGVAFVTPTTAAPPSASSISIIDAAFIYRFRWLALSTTDFAISFYDMNESRSTVTTSTGSATNFALLKNLGLTTSTAQLILRFCESSALLASSGNDFVVNVWKVLDAETKVVWRRLSGHADLVMDLVEIVPHDLLACCDLKHNIQLWDLVDGRPRGSLSAHERGIRQLCYSSQHDLLLSAGFEYEALAWDLSSRQVVLKLSGHRAPLVGVQLAMFQTERAITGDIQGVFKVWDITRGNASSSTASTSQAVQLESIDLAMPRVETLSFVCMHPHNRDLWVVTSGSCTLQSFRSMRVQQFDEVPLRAFYHYSANKFVVVAGSVCSLWDGETGSCIEEFANVGHLGGSQAASTKDSAPVTSPSKSSSHPNRSEPGTELLICAHDSNCRKLVVVSELGELGVLNAQNFVQMRRCQETFMSRTRSQHRASVAGRPLVNSTPSCAIVGLHYCSENKLIVMTDAAASAIIVVNDNSDHDSSKGIEVLRKLVNIPDGIVTSAYSFHASMVATVAADSEAMTISLWDFETLTFLGNCRCEPSTVKQNSPLNMHVVEFWDEFPVLLAADSSGGVYFFAVMPLLNAYTGKLLHAFPNDHGNDHDPTKRRRTRKKSTIPENAGENGEDDDGSDGEDESSKTAAANELAESAARKLLASKFLRKNALISAPVIKANESTKSKSPMETSALVTSMKMVFDEENQRYLLFVGDERGYVGVWDPASMMRRLTLAKIPEIKCKYLRRGYQPKAMFFRDYLKDSTNADGRGQKHRQAVQGATGSDWRGAMLLGEDMEYMNVRASHVDLKKLSRRRQEGRAPRSTKTVAQPAKTLPPTKAKETAVVNAVAAAEFLLGKGSTLKQSRQRSIVGLAKAHESDGSWPGSSSYENYPHDVQLVRRWQAHGDAITSLEISRHPNIVMTCGVDMRIFVWNWDGECLGKLFDADNPGSWAWRFRKDDATRTKEREVLVQQLLRELDRSPTDKLEQRRQTLYSDHVGRRSVNDLHNVNTMLLDHIISKNPEIQLLEQEAKNKEKNAEEASDMVTPLALSEPRIKATKLRALPKNASRATSTSTSAQKLRLHTLNQLHPHTRAKVQDSTTETRDRLPFSETGELKMDKAYLENQLSISCPKSTSITITRANREALQEQIHAEYESAQQALETRATLDLKARAMYGNLESIRNRHGPRQLPFPENFDQAGGPLEPSDFLKRNLPASALAIRPQTAPIRGLNNSSSVGRLGMQHQHASRAPTRMKISASESTLPTMLTHERATRRPSTSANGCKTSLDEVFIEQSRRQRQQQQLGNGIVEGGTVEGDNQPPRPLQKLRGINEIIDRAQTFCNEVEDDQQQRHLVRPGTAPVMARRSSLILSQSLIEHPTDDDGDKEDDEVLHQHLEDTKRRMQEAMHDGKHPHQRNMRRIREQAKLQQQQRRMNSYVQQKRRELTTNIGNVFKGLQTAQDHDEHEDDDTEEGEEEADVRFSKQKSSPKAKGDKLPTDPAAKRLVTAKKAFGMYNAQEVMSVIRLFRSIDADASGNISMTELQQYKTVFEKLGHHNLISVFETIDSNGDGEVSLRELLETCFHYATKPQIDGMLQLAKVGSVRSFLLGVDNPDDHNGKSSSSSSRKSSGAVAKLHPDHRQELMSIFRVFDHNGDGGVSMQEIMEALRVDDDDVMAAVMAREHDKGPRSIEPVVSSGLTREDVEQIYNEYDRDKDAALDFDEFVGVMRSLYSHKPLVL